MAENLKTIQLRMQTVNKVSKITNAMKLVSVAKLQKYQVKMREFESMTEEFLKMPTVSTVAEADQDPSKRLVVCIAPDLGMSAKYNNTLYNALLEEGFTQVVWLGHQFYEKVASTPGLTLLNDKVASEGLDIEALYDRILDWEAEGNRPAVGELFLAVPHLDHQDLRVDFRNLSLQLDERYDIVYEPNFAEANGRFRYLYRLLNLYDAYYAAKYSENMTRRMAMEAATENADEMREALQNRYNQLRQEEITMEILELSQES